MNKLPKYWIVRNDCSQLYKDTVIKYLNETYNKDWTGVGYNYYGYSGSNKYNGYQSEFKNNPTQLTLKQFIEMTTKEEFTRGELIVVRDRDERAWEKAIFLHHDEMDYEPFRCVCGDDEKEFKNGEKYASLGWKQARKIKETHNIKITDNGKEITIEEMNEIINAKNK